MYEIYSDDCEKTNTTGRRQCCVMEEDNTNTSTNQDEDHEMMLEHDDHLV